MSRYSTVVIEINTDNAAFEDDAGAEVARILRELATRYENEGFFAFHSSGDRTIRDINGNVVGSCR